MGTVDILLGVTLQWTSIPSTWGGNTLSYTSCYRNRDKLSRVGLLGSRATLPSVVVVVVSIENRKTGEKHPKARTSDNLKPYIITSITSNDIRNVLMVADECSA